MEIVTDFLSVMDYRKRKMYDGDESIYCWLNGDRSEFEFAFSCKKGVGVKQIKRLVQSSKRYQRSNFTGISSYEILIKKLWAQKKKKHYKLNSCMEE